MDNYKLLTDYQLTYRFHISFSETESQPTGVAPCDQLINQRGYSSNTSQSIFARAQLGEWSLSVCNTRICEVNHRKQKRKKWRPKLAQRHNQRIKISGLEVSAGKNKLVACHL